MLNKDFDFYYLIICSRGPGSETMVVDNVSGRRDSLRFYEGSEDQFKKIGACAFRTARVIRTCNSGACAQLWAPPAESMAAQ